MGLYPAKICHLYWLNKRLIGQNSGKKYRWGNQTRKILERKPQAAVATQTQQKQDENVALRKGTKPHG